MNTVLWYKIQWREKKGLREKGKEGGGAILDNMIGRCLSEDGTLKQKFSKQQDLEAVSLQVNEGKHSKQKRTCTGQKGGQRGWQRREGAVITHTAPLLPSLSVHCPNPTPPPPVESVQPHCRSQPTGPPAQKLQQAGKLWTRVWLAASPARLLLSLPPKVRTSVFFPQHVLEYFVLGMCFVLSFLKPCLGNQTS